MEDKYYDKFAQMEKAMTKLNEQTSSLSGMLGTG
jgi:flagellar hook-associated protein 2